MPNFQKSLYTFASLKRQHYMNQRLTEIEEALLPGEFLNSDHQSVIDYAKETTTGVNDPVEQIQALFLDIRERFRYDPYNLNLNREAVKSSHLLTRNHGYCIEKSGLLVSTARVLGIPGRMAFANVKNHIGTAKLEAILKTNLLVFHGYAEIYLHDRWIKLAPIFNRSLCEKLNVDTLEFDGENDAVFQEFDHSGGQFMEYIHEYGSFNDVPYKMFIGELAKHYPHLAHHLLKMEDLNLQIT